MAQTLAKRRAYITGLPVTTTSGAGVELLPVEITPDEPKESMAALTPSLSTQTTVLSVPAPARWSSVTVT